MEIVHFLSAALPEPHGCGGLRCAECARHALTAVHFSPDGICAFGHKLDLAGWLTDWIKAEGITGHYPPDQIAARVVASIHHKRLTGWLTQGGTDYLRDMCARIKDEADLTDAQFCHERAHH